jgi:hypothetical protein
MSPVIVALVFSTLAVIAAWRIKRGLETGVSGDSLYRFRADTNPIGFLVILGGKAFVIILWIAFVLHACGWVGDPIKALRPYVEPFH